MCQRYDFDDFSFPPQHQRYEHYEQPRRYEQRYEPRQLQYNRGRIVDPVEQLRQLLQAAPIANALAPPALAPPWFSSLWKTPYWNYSTKLFHKKMPKTNLLMSRAISVTQYSNQVYATQSRYRSPATALMQSHLIRDIVMCKLVSYLSLSPNLMLQSK
jgi:hypothetical protein